jgi:hypothetical protein
MSTQIKMRRGTTSQHSSFTGAEAEVTIDTDKEVAVVHNGSTAGGFPLARADQTLALAGGAITGNVTFGDNDKAIFGAGSDLQIYHNASNSFIQDVGTGKLHITSDGTGVSIDKGTSELMATFDTDGAVTLYHNALAKLATTATGVDVTGTLTATKLVSTDGILELDDNGSHNGIINSPASLMLNIDSDNGATNEKFVIAKDRTSTSGGTELFKVQEDGNVGIGVTPEGVLSIPSTNSNTPRIRFQHPSVTGDAAIDTFQDGGGTYLSMGQNMYFASNGSATKFNTSEEANMWYFDPGGPIVGYTATSGAGFVERMRIQSTAGAGLRVSDGIDVLDGNLIVAAGHGIDFSATAGSGSSELFSDYEEGTFAPAMTLSTPGNSSFAYLSQSGQYRKVGQTVTFTLELRMNTISYGTGSGSLFINGFPFNFANTGGYGSSLCTILLSGTAIASGRTPAAQGLSNTANLNLVQMISSAVPIALVVSNYNTIQVSGTYITP